MKILLISIGTRGDMEPFLAVGRLLKERGHEVVCAFPEQFKRFVNDTNIGFTSLGTGFIDMVESDTAKTALGGSGFKKFFALFRLAIGQTEINRNLTKDQFKIIEEFKPDRIVHNPKALYPVIWGKKCYGKNILLSPVPYLHYVKGHPHIAFSKNYGEVINKLTFSLAGFGYAVAIKMSLKWLNIKMKLKRKEIIDVCNNCKTVYTISPALFNRDGSFTENIRILGYHERNKTINWEPPEELCDFLNTHEKVIYIGFGSMTNPEPAKITKTAIDIFERHKVPAIICTGGGFIEPESYNRDLFFFVKEIPHDYIFPKVYGVIHHGGSGTTHMGLKYGCATLIIPHIIDQFVWNKIVNEIGAGPLGVKIGKFSEKTFEPLLLELIKNRSFKQKAEEISEKMRSEDYVDELCSFIENQEFSE